MPEVTVVEAVNLALGRAMEDDPDVVVLGEDVGVSGGVFRATAGLQKRFGAERVLDTPLAELLISGLCVGMAAQGFRRRDPVYGVYLSLPGSTGEPRVPNA
jgi:2-oxoisovalerate dehydrogenase E1 component beta subunit